jgi:hypothetical protein
MKVKLYKDKRYSKAIKDAKTQTIKRLKKEIKKYEHRNTKTNN